MYRNKTVTQSITVTKEVDSITVKQLPTKTEYIQNKEDLDLSNGIITITYKDGTTEELAMTSSLVQVSGFDNTNLGQVTITLTYKTKTLNFTIEIIAEVNRDKCQFTFIVAWLSQQNFGNNTDIHWYGVYLTNSMVKPYKEKHMSPSKRMR